MKVSEIMTKDVIFLLPGNTVAEAVEIFARKRISGAPVVDEKGDLLGIVTDADLLANLRVVYKKYNISFPTGVGMTSVAFKAKTKYQDLMKAFKDMAKTLIKDIMVKKVVTVGPNDMVERVIPLLVGKKINLLPVVKNDDVVGIISRDDIIKALLKE